MGDPQGHPDNGAVHLLPSHPQEVGLGQVVVEDGQDGGLGAVIIGGPVAGVVAQVGSEVGRHGGGPHRPALPLQEEGTCSGTLSQDAEGVGVDGA